MEEIAKAIEIIKEKILTPVIYTVYDDFGVSFIGFFDGKLKVSELHDVEELIHDMLGVKVDILDIRDMAPSRRIEIIGGADEVYCENDFVRNMFEMSIVEDYKRLQGVKQSLIDRSKNCDSMYMS